ncbi:MAG: WYL domain-containing protein [Treponema sp.]|nr:WYL domain-containing protein [Treponema sp.]
MAYSELIKNIDTLRTYIRNFYIYGFKTRNKFHGKSSRTYDDEKRRLENYLDGYMTFRSDENGKVSFLSIDSRHTIHNPLYKIFKAKSFTAIDISLHFMLMDILFDGEKKTLNQILDEISDVYLKDFSSDAIPEESTVRKKLKEYEGLGLIASQKDGKTMLYFRKAMTDLTGLGDALAFFSEIAQCGVVGNFLFDKLNDGEQKDSEIFQFKHHYITSSIESDFVEMVFEAIREHRSLTIEQKREKNDRTISNEVLPLMIYQSTQDGRMYLMAYRYNGKYFLALRFDYILTMKVGEVYPGFEQKRAEFEDLRKHIWGVALRHKKKHNDTKTEHVSFCLHFEDDEQFIYQRLLREKRCGKVTRLDENNVQFDADVFDAMEIIPWARTFICRITEFKCSDNGITRRFYNDIKKMKQLYFVRQKNLEETNAL